MTTELELQEKIQAVIQSLSFFSDSDVVINDWSIFDRPNVEAPYVLIETADDIESLHRTMTPETRWGIPIILVEEFTDWKDTLDKFQLRREAMIAALNSGDARSGSGINISRIYNDTPVTPYYDKMIPTELLSESMPVFIMQRIILETELY